MSKIIAIPSDHANSVAPTPGGPARRVAARGPRSSQIPKSAPAARRTRLHAIAFYPLLGLVCLAVAVASFIALANPADVVRDRLAADAKTRLGRHLSVAGGASLTFLPFGVLLRDVELSAPDSPGSPLVRAAAVDVRVSLLSLLRQQVAVNALTITRPEINLSVDASGRSNWDFALARDTETRSVQLAQLAPRLGFGRDLPPDLLGGQGRSDAASKGPTPGAGRQGSETVIDVSVQDGLIRYSDTRSDVTKQITAVNLHVGLNGRARPANLSGDFIWAGEPVSLEVATDALDGTSARADIRLKSRMFDMAYSGRVSLTGATELDGRLTGRSRSIDTLARWLRGADPHPETGAERGAAVEGRLRVSGATLELSDASIKVGGTSASGSISVDPSQRPPFIRADLKVAALDLDQAAPVSSGSAGQPSAAPRAEAHGARSIDDLLTRSDGKGTRPEGPGRLPPDQGYQASRPLDVSILQLANLDGRFEIGKLRWRGLDVGQAHVATTIAGGKLTANATEAHLYGGRAEGSLVIEPHGTRAAINLNTTIDGVATQALLKDLLDFDWLDGRGQLVLMLSGEGASEKQIIDSLHGRAQIKVAEGALIGWDLTQMLRGLRQGTLPSTDRHPSARTRFGDLTGSFVIADGVARNEDLKVTGQSISVSGSGAVAYRDRSIDYTVRPRLSEAAGGLEDVEIPVRIHGTWEKPVLSPDLDSVLKDPRTAAKVQQLGRQLRSGNIDGALKGVLGDGPKAEKKAEKAKEFLKRFLKQ